MNWAVVAKYWQEIPDHSSNAKLLEWVVMPNHVHGVIELIETPVGSRHGVILPEPIYNKFGKTNPGSISSIINQFKGSIKRWCNKNNYGDFAWQARFHDRVIRNDDELYNVQMYIQNNPQKWEQDRNNPGNL